MLSAFLSLYFSSFLSNPALTVQERQEPIYKNEFTVSPLPLKIKEGDPEVQASSSLIMDVNTGTILWEKEIDSKKQIASITKLMTALVVLEENDLNDVVTISSNTASIEGSKIWIAPGEKLSIQDLIAAIIIHSANDAAYALAEFNAGSIKKFVEKMNKKAQQLGLENTHFSNPAGFDGPENFSTARDIALLARYAYRNAFLRYIASISELEIKSIRGTKYKLETTNGLLKKDPRFKGLKTGHTNEAGYSFVGVAEIDKVYPVIVIVFNSPNRFQESINLVNWVQDHYIW